MLTQIKKKKNALQIKQVSLQAKRATGCYATQL